MHFSLQPTPPGICGVVQHDGRSSSAGEHCEEGGPCAPTDLEPKAHQASVMQGRQLSKSLTARAQTIYSGQSGNQRVSRLSNLRIYFPSHDLLFMTHTHTHTQKKS